jgi:hypothetical protein
MEKLLFSTILGGLYAGIVFYIIPAPVSFYVMIIGGVIVGWFSNNIFKFLFGR